MSKTVGQCPGVITDLSFDGDAWTSDEVELFMEGLRPRNNLLRFIDGEL